MEFKERGDSCRAEWAGGSGLKFVRGDADNDMSESQRNNRNKITENMLLSRCLSFNRIFSSHTSKL